MIRLIRQKLTILKEQERKRAGEALRGRDGGATHERTRTITNNIMNRLQTKNRLVILT